MFFVDVYVFDEELTFVILMTKTVVDPLSCEVETTQMKVNKSSYKSELSLTLVKMYFISLDAQLYKMFTQSDHDLTSSFNKLYEYSYQGRSKSRKRKSNLFFLL